MAKWRLKVDYSVLSHSVTLCMMLLVLILIFLGHGFHLRQGWVGYRKLVNKTANGTEYERVMCGQPADKSYDSGACRLEDKTRNVSSLKGYEGFLPVGDWAELDMLIQFFIVVAMFITISFKAFVLYVTIKDSNKSKGVSTHSGSPDGSKRLIQPDQRLLPHLLMAAIMFLIFCIEAFYANCGRYPKTKLKLFEEHALKENLAFPARPEDIVVECWVDAFGNASFLSFAVAFFACVDAVFVHRARKAPRHTTTFDDDGKAGKSEVTAKKDSTPSLDEGSVTTDQMHEHGKPDDIQEVSESKDTEPDLGIKGGVHIKVEGGKSGSVVFANVATMVKSKELGEPGAKEARKSFKKDKSGPGDSDGRKKEMVFNYINEHGGSIVDPAKKGAYLKINPGGLH